MDSTVRAMAVGMMVASLSTTKATLWAARVRRVRMVVVEVEDPQLIDERPCWLLARTMCSPCWLSLAWTHECPYPTTPLGRLQYEADRLAVIQQRRAEMTNPTSFLTFSVMAQDEESYGAGLRGDVVAARPGLDEVLPVWDQKTTEERTTMHGLKLESLIYTRDNPGINNSL